MTPDLSNVFVPADDADSGQFDVQLTDPPLNRGAGAKKALSIGLLIGLMAVACMFLLRDAIVANAPGLAPLLPPKAAPARPRPANPPGAGLIFDAESAKVAMAICSGFVHLIVLVVLPLGVPPILSRLHLLSVGRWLIMAAVSGFFTIVVFTPFFVLSVATTVEVGELRRPLAMILANIGLYASISSFFGIPGCLLAAALHPKTSPAS